MEVSGLPQGAHGTHVHENAACTAPDFLSAGGHFDHSGAGHNHGGAKGHHAGDLPNLMIGPDGRGSMDAMIPAVTLSGTGSHSLFRGGGTSLVIHEAEDDLISEPSGGSGRRIACGVIRQSS
jgi:Cu-Zn family superoxide dismutase